MELYSLFEGFPCLAFDVETPNSRNDRMSAIGIARIENGLILEEISTLVNPEEPFDAFNVALTGITPRMAAAAPVFPELWEQYGVLFSSSILIAHNAPFDLSVLSRCLRDYGLEAPRYLPYCCTVRMGRRCYPELANHRLDTLCRYRDIPLDHHNAGSDSRACADLFLDYGAHGFSAGEFLRLYDRLEGRTLRKKETDALLLTHESQQAERSSLLF